MIADRRPRQIVLDSPAVFYQDDLPAMATHCRQSECGLSLYKGVLVVWDEDRDTRVLKFIDGLTPEDREQILVVQEHEGSIQFLCDRYLPYSCEGSVEVDGDNWSVDETKVLRS